MSYNANRMKRNGVGSVLILALLLPALASAQGIVFLRNDLNVTLDSSGVALTQSQALGFDLGLRSLKTSSTGIRGVATSALGTLDSTTTASLALGATYVRSSRENVSHLPLCVMSFFVNGVGDCFFVPDPPIDNWDPLFSLNTIASFPFALDEVDSNGTVVKRFEFEALSWARTTLNASSGNSSSQLAVFEWTANLTAPATPPPSPPTNTTVKSTTVPATVNVAFVQSSILGVVNLDTSPVLPKTWEIVVRIRSYNLSSTNHSLMLEVAAATGFGVNRTQPGIISLTGANDTNHWGSAYAQMGTASALNNGSGTATQSPVKTTTFNLIQAPLSGAQLEFAPILVEQLTVRYGRFGVWRSNATFAAGAANLDYQIRAGIGPVLDAQPLSVTPPSPPSNPPTITPTTTPPITTPTTPPTGQLSAATSLQNNRALVAFGLLSFVLLYLF